MADVIDCPQIRFQKMLELASNAAVGIDKLGI